MPLAGHPSIYSAILPISFTTDPESPLVGLAASRRMRNGSDPKVFRHDRYLETSDEAGVLQNHRALVPFGVLTCTVVAASSFAENDATLEETRSLVRNVTQVLAERSDVRQDSGRAGLREGVS